MVFIEICVILVWGILLLNKWLVDFMIIGNWLLLFLRLLGWIIV